MAREWISVCLLLLCAHATIQKSTPESDHYIAAVVEYSADISKLDDGPWTLRINTDAYVGLIKTAAEGNADIIVFPEDGLTGLGGMKPSNMEQWSTIVPSPADNYVPCANNAMNVSETLKRLSCAARNHQIYVVANMAEKFCKTDTCSQKDTVYYNTNVVFDRTGKVIARYRKTHLFMELQFSMTDKPEIVTFDTDFGVTFGTFVCFDILFHEPSLNLTRNAGVTDIVYSTAWFSEVPFLTAAQAQFGWSYAENVNLLASGYNLPENGNTGSGIYLGHRGIGTTFMAAARQTELLIHTVPKIKRDKNGEKLEMDPEPQKPAEQTTPLQSWKDGNLQLMYDKLTVMKTADVNEITLESLCDGNFCCQFEIKMQNVDKTTKYKIAAFRGSRMFGSDVKAAVTVCGLMQCANDSLSSCGDVSKSNTVFNKIEIGTTFHFYDDNLIMPVTLDSHMLPIDQFTMMQHKHDNHVHVSMSLQRPTKNLATFAVYSRDFSKDGDNAAASNYVSFWSFLGTLIIGIAYLL